MARSRRPNASTQVQVLYDDGCRVCSVAAQVLQRLDRGGAFEVLGFSEAQRRGLHRGIPPGEFHAAFHLLEKGRRWSGADAVPRVLEHLPLTRPLVRIGRRVPGAAALNRTLYAIISRYRHLAGCRTCGTPVRGPRRAKHRS